MTNPNILWRESFGYGSLSFDQVYLFIERNIYGIVSTGGSFSLEQGGRGSGSDQGYSIRGSSVGPLGLRATTLGFSGAIDTHAMTNNKVGVAFAYQQGGNVGGSIMCEFWDDDGLGDGSFDRALLHFSVETLADGRLCIKNGSGTAPGVSGTPVAISTFVMPVGLAGLTGNYTHIEIVNPVIHASTGSVQVYANGVLVLNASGISTRHSAGGSGKIGYVQPYVNTGRYMTDLILHDCANSGLIGDKRVTYRRASVAGTYTGGVATGAGTRLGCVSEQAADGDTTYILIDDAGLPTKVSFTTEAMPANTVSIDEVTEHVIHRKSDASANTAQYGMRSGGTDYLNGSDLATPSGYSIMTQTGPAPGRPVDPHTSAAWSIPNCDAVEIIYDRTA